MKAVWMAKAIALAKKGMGKVYPNPLVGCIIVKDDKVLSQGWHQMYKGPHAETNALQQISADDEIVESEMYVNLEPCTHFGHTPPCVDLIVRKKIKKIFVAHTDPNPQVNGKGIAYLRKKGIVVHTGLCKTAAQQLNRHYCLFHTHQRPYITLKWAQTVDGYMARKNLQPQWISHPKARQLVHQWRSQHAAVLVGTRTVLHDNPKLNIRYAIAHHQTPTRIFIDKFLRCPSHFFVLNQKQPTLCYNFIKHQNLPFLTYVRLDPKKNFLQQLLYDLYQRNIQSVLVEGGAYLLHTLIQENFWDEARVFTANMYWNEGVLAPRLPGNPHSTQKIYTDDLHIYYQNQSSGGYAGVE